MAKSKAQIYREDVLALEASGVFCRSNNPDLPTAGLDTDGNLFLMEDDDHLEPKEALRLAAWIIDMFEERYV
jgi:hypothetical protein